jgi:MFS family permease
MTQELHVRRRWWILPSYLLAALSVRTADQGARIALVLLALDAGKGAALGGVLVAALLVPHLVAAPLVGVAMDRTTHPRALLAGSFLLFAASLLVSAQIINSAPVGLVVAILIVGGCCGPAITGGLTSYLPGLVGEKQTPRAFGMDSLFYNIASTSGPAMAGALAATGGPMLAQSALAICAALGALVVTVLPIAASNGNRAGRGNTRLLDGVREILGKPTLRVVTFSTSLGQLGQGALPVAVVVLATSLHHPAASGYLLSAIAIGSLVGTILWTWHPVMPGRAPLLTALCMIGVGVPIVASALVGSIVGVGLLFAMSGLFLGPFSSALFLTRTQEASENVRSQVFTVGAGLKVGVAALGSILIGFAVGLSVSIQVFLIGMSSILAGILGVVGLAMAPRKTEWAWPQVADGKAGAGRTDGAE